MAQTMPFDPANAVRGAVRDLPSYIPSRPQELPTRLIRLDMNESPYGPSPKARAFLADFEATNRYPDFGQSRLIAALSAYVNVPGDQIIAGAGLDDVLTSLANLVIDPGDEVIISDPTFGVYRVITALRGGVTVNVPLTPDFQLDADGVLAALTERTKLIVICSPNNPTGNLLDSDAIERICANAACIVAIDEAYAEFAGVSHIPLMERHRNVAYGMFPRVLVPFLHHVTPPFHNISVPSSLAAIASLDDLDYLRQNVDRIVADRDALSDQLREIPGVTPFESKTNFVLARLPVENAGPVVAELARQGILVRYFGNPAHGLVDCLRVSVGTTEENEAFLTALTSILANPGVIL
jgi:histidinol-phosphate aminotransferase